MTIFSTNTGSFEHVTINSGVTASNALITGVATVRELRTLIVTSSVIYESGSTKFGDSVDDTHQFTGSLGITGELVINGTSYTSATSGTSGTSGSSGSAGSSGTAGSSGSSGTSGSSGSSGTSGSSGSAGTSGSSGSAGTSGSSGSAGTSGSSGSAGSSGSSGTSGSAGTSGTSGSAGTSGVNGSSGTSGVNGSSGTSGANGSSGSSGTSGANGSSGTSGANGSSGTSGVNGSSGTSGANGNSGSSGTSGANGSSGTSGTSASVTINDNTNNYVVTATGTTNTLQGESNLVFDGTNLGVGTTNPANKLQIGSVGSSGYGGNDLVIGNGTQVMAFYVYSGGPSAWFTNTNFALMNSGVGSTGNVGIGTTSPAAKLDILGDNNQLYLTTNGNYASIYPLHSGTNTGAIYWNTSGVLTIEGRTATGQIIFGTGGTSIERMRINTSGSVGIGTTNPGYKLDIFTSTSTTDAQIRIKNTYANVSSDSILNVDGYGASVIKLWRNGVEQWKLERIVGTDDLQLNAYGAAVNDGAGVGVVQFWDYDSGKVGIGTTVPVNKLHVYGTAAASSTSADNGVITMGMTNGVQLSIGAEPASPYGVYLQTKDANNAGPYGYPLLLNPKNGNVGIGTTSPGGRLHIVNSGGGTTATNYLNIEGATGNNSNYPGIQLTGGTLANVYPQLVLTNGGLATEWSVGYHTSNYPQRASISMDAANYGIAFNTSTTGAVSERMRINSSGNVGIGTTNPNVTLSIYSTTSPGLNFRNSTNVSSTYGFTIEATGNNSELWNYANGYMRFGTNNNERVRIDASGNVGIGTTSPQAKLDVRGGILRSNSRVSDSQNYPVGHYTPGDVVFEIDPTWTQDELREFFGSSGVSWVTDSTAPGGYSIEVAGNINVGGAYNSGFPYIPVDDDDTFYMECWIKNTVGTNNAHYMGSIDYNSGFTSLGGNPGSFGYWVMSNYNPGTSWTKVSGHIKGFGSSTGQFVSGTKFWTPQALFNYSNSGTCYISGWKATKVTQPGEKIFKASVGIGTTARPSYALDVTGTIRATADVIAYSDRRAKENIITISNALQKVVDMRGVYYNMIDDQDKTRKIGVIAQEILEVAPELVSYVSDKDQYSVAYGNITALLIEAIKELTTTVNKLEHDNTELRSRITTLEG